MAKKDTTMTGEPGTRDCVVRDPRGQYINVYFGSRTTPVSLNEATRFSETKARHWITEHTAERYDKRTGLRVENPDLFGPEGENFDLRPSTQYKIQRVKTAIIEDID